MVLFSLYKGIYHVFILLPSTYEPHNEKTCFMPYANNKSADQSAHLCSLISAFVVRYLDSKIKNLLYPKIQDSS